eukprot:CAMPEP_0206438056 /NCGR_PEP_ID=MMETSP0324_2-20121206/11395_1 /ASSEMBLY_ACC=CAM_ASM_000836 /TAXON_ID=2866 /ORGANISM="Crypthecodinium cohnii, Strain Seligo" /LENGTH=340 /DNA_ID=CAMNT_0053905427 /DNA_START=157 /DNA_END=1179 /DNA_ORIENTATION=-
MGRRQLRPSRPIAPCAFFALVGACLQQLPRVLSESALEAARALVPPAPSVSKDGEFEGHDFWEEHDELLTKAWKELRPVHPSLYTFDRDFEDRYIVPDFRSGAEIARTRGDESALLSLFEEPIPGVFATEKIFAPAFLQELLSELKHIQNSGIPKRRPNGMNRYGVILDQVGFKATLQELCRQYLAPLAGALFPELVKPEDAEEHYAFTIQYEGGGDVALAEHGDASVVTINLCLGEDAWEGGSVRFHASDGKGYLSPDRSKQGSGDVNMTPGLALIHRGQHKHQALQLLTGRRTNLVIWLMGRHDVVRVAPYPSSEQATVHERWNAYPTSFGSRPPEEL